jgi:tRNA 2-thiocytidine biosynthesis protein TtcA
MENAGDAPHGGGDVERLRAKVSRRMLRTVGEFRLVEDKDRILVAVSGGKDSYTLLDLLWAAKRKAPVDFELIAFHLDQAQPGYDGGPLRRWLERLGAPFEIVREDTYSAVIAEAEADDRATYCRLCSRLRRGILYAAATRLGCNKVALGHHRDDALETLLLNLFYAGRLQAMPARYTTNDGALEVIRPLIECGLREIADHASAAGYPILPCRLCGSQEDLKRVRVAKLLRELEQEIPDLRQVMLAALKNVRPSHLLDAEVAAAWLDQAESYPPRR